MIVAGILLVISIANYARILPESQTRAVEFVYIFVIGALSGFLLNEALKSRREKEKNHPA